MELRESTGYATTVVGAAFRAEIGFERVKFWLPMEGKRKSVKSSDIVSVSALPNGYTKISVRMVGDIIVPTSATESVLLQKFLNTLITEIHSTEFRRRQTIFSLASLPGRQRLLGFIVGSASIMAGMWLMFYPSPPSPWRTFIPYLGFIVLFIGFLLIFVSLAGSTGQHEAKGWRKLRYAGP